MTGEVKPQDRDSGLVERRWVRTSRRGGETTERTLEGEAVTARFQPASVLSPRLPRRNIVN